MFLINHQMSGWVYNMADFDVNNNKRGTGLEGTQNITSSYQTQSTNALPLKTKLLCWSVAN